MQRASSAFASKSVVLTNCAHFTILEQAYLEVDKLNKPYPIIDRLNTVNAKLRNAEGQPELLIDSKCKHLIRALETLTYKVGTKIPDNLNPVIHVSVALGYLIMGAFPLSAWSDWGIYPGQSVTAAAPRAEGKRFSICFYFGNSRMLRWVATTISVPRRLSTSGCAAASAYRLFNIDVSHETANSSGEVDMNH